jgi:hypothetical protein
MPDPYKPVVSSMQYERGHVNERQKVADINALSRPHRCQGHCWTRVSIPGPIPPGAKSFVIGDAGRNHCQVVNTSIDGVGLDDDFTEGVQQALRNSDGVIRRPRQPSKAVYEHQMTDSLRVRDGQQKSLWDGACECEHRRPFGFDRLHDRHGVAHPLLKRWRTQRRYRIRQP